MTVYGILSQNELGGAALFLILLRVAFTILCPAGSTNFEFDVAATAPSWFQRFAVSSAVAMGSKWAFGGAIVLTVAWVALGPVYQFSDTWQLWMNTLTTVVTFLMVFVIQNTQNREALATQLKLDEIIRAIHSAHDEMIDIERLSDEEMEKLSQLYHKIRAESDARAARRNAGL